MEAGDGLRAPRAGDEQALAAALDRLGPELRRVREEHGITLDGLARRTGASKSTLSRLESGQRRPTVELLLRVALVYGMTLDELIGFPGYARFSVPSERIPHGTDRVAWRLTRSPVVPTPYKLVYAATECEPPSTLPAHDGWMWVFVISGRLRVIVGDGETVLERGEAAEIDTRRPHWTGSTGDAPVEVLVLVAADTEHRTTPQLV